MIKLILRILMVVPIFITSKLSGWFFVKKKKVLLCVLFKSIRVQSAGFFYMATGVVIRSSYRDVIDVLQNKCTEEEENHKKYFWISIINYKQKYPIGVIILKENGILQAYKKMEKLIPQMLNGLSHIEIMFYELPDNYCVDDVVIGRLCDTKYLDDKGVKFKMHGTKNK